MVTTNNTEILATDTPSMEDSEGDIAAIFTEQTGSNNPFNGIDIRDDSHPVFADIDADGKTDVVIGRRNGTLKYFRNTGTSTSPVYEDQTNDNNPFFGIFTSEGASSPAFIDVDGDGDLDGLFGNAGEGGESGVDGLEYYENTGSSATPDYVKRTGTNNPFDTIGFEGTHSTPAFADLNGDDILDVVAGNRGGGLDYFEGSTGLADEIDDRVFLETVLEDAIAPEGRQIEPLVEIVNTEGTRYTQKTGTNNPFNNFEVSGGYSRPAFADVDGDGDLDAVVGNNVGELTYYKNTGNSTDPDYERQSSDNSPFDGIDVGTRSAPTLTDLDNDGDADLLVGASDGTLRYFKNTTGDASDEPSDLLTPFADDGAVEITNLLEDSILQISSKQVGVEGAGKIVVWLADDAAGTEATQVAELALLEGGKIPLDFMPSLMLADGSISEGQFIQVKLIKNGETRSSSFASVGDGQVSLDFGDGTVLTVQAVADEADANLLVGDAEAIDLSAGSGDYTLAFNVYREASYNNTVGFYTTDMANGGIITDELLGTVTMPGDEGYREAAIARQLDTQLTGENGTVKTFTADMAGGSYVGTFLIADGSDLNSDNLYFSHAGANSSGNDHVKLLGNNTFGFEDMAGLGDRDYNDIVVQFSATSPPPALLG